MILLLLILFSTINLGLAKDMTCDKVYDECTNESNKATSEWYNWATGRSACDDAFNICIYIEKKRK